MSSLVFTASRCFTTEMSVSEIFTLISDLLLLHTLRQELGIGIAYVIENRLLGAPPFLHEEGGEGRERRGSCAAFIQYIIINQALFFPPVSFRRYPTSFHLINTLY